MERDDAKQKFQDADRLFQAKQFQAALRVLRELNKDFPGERHILYPMARCLTGLKQYKEAREIAELIVHDFNYMPARELLGRIDRLQSFDEPDPEMPALPSALDGIMLTPAAFGGGPPPLPAARATGGNWQPYALWSGLLLGGFALLVVVGLTLARPALEWQLDYQSNQEQYTANPDTIPAVPWGSLLIMFAANLCYWYVLACLPAYWSLRVFDALKYDDFGENMKDAAIITLIGLPLMWIPVLGWIAFLIVLKRRYELSFARLAGTVLLFCVFDIALSWPVGLIYKAVLNSFVA